MQPVIEARDLYCGYGGKAICGPISFQCGPGQIVCLIGPNGAGKSTILRTLAGLLPPIKGEVLLSGIDIKDAKSSDRAKKIAVVLTDRFSVPMTSSKEIVSMGRQPYTGFFGKLTEGDKKTVTKALEKAGALHLAGRQFMSLSDGEKQKVLIARALAQEPKLMVLDEPTSHLDIRHKIELVKILGSLARDEGLAVVLALHEIDIASRACQTILMLKDGKTVGQGSPEDILDNSSVASLYSISGASYDAVLGGFEMSNTLSPEIFVFCGAGSGAPVLRSLSRSGFGIAAGVLMNGDVDKAIASSMGIPVVDGGDGGALSEAESIMQSCFLAVDSAFPINGFSQPTIDLLDERAGKGMPVATLRPEAEAKEAYRNSSSLIYAQSIGGLAQLAEKLKMGGC